MAEKCQLPFKLRSIQSQKYSIFKIESKQVLRQVITDFIIHNISIATSSLTRKMKTRKYEPVTLQLEINQRNQSYSFELPMILEKYIALFKQQQQYQVGIEPLVLDILDFIERLEDRAALMSLEIVDTVNPQKILSILINQHLRDRRKIELEGQYDEVRKKIYTKYKKVSFMELGQRGVARKQCELLVQKGSQENSQRISRSTLNALEKEREASGKRQIPIPTKSKLKTLVDSCNIFSFPQRIETLKKEKIIAEFCGNKQAELIEARKIVKKSYPCPQNSSLAPETAKLLQQWINDISTSEYLFKKKFKSNKENMNFNASQSSSSSSETQRQLP